MTRALLGIALAALVSSCGGAEPARDDGATVARYGISTTAPAGWGVRIGRGVLVAAPYPLAPETTGSPWEEMNRSLAGDGIRLLLREGSTTNRSPPAELSLYRDLWPLRFDPGHFRADPNAGPEPIARRLFRHAGRLFHADVVSGSLPPAPETLSGLNELLRSLEIEPGDFYPGLLEPPRFTPRAGWHVGDSGVEDVDADGEWTTAWASTIPYVDAWNALPPFGTLERLPEHGAVIWVNLARDGRFRPEWPERSPPFDLDTFERLDEWEGMVRGLPEHRLWATVHGDTHLDVRVWFGRRDPAPATKAEAQALLDGLMLPDWGPWELEP